MNKFLIITLSVILSLFSSANLFAEATSSQTVYMTRENESLDSIAVKLLPRYKEKYNKRVEDFKKDLTEWNPQVTKWNPIPEDTNIYIEYPYPVYISHKWAPTLRSK